MMTIRHYKVESPLNSLLRLDMCQLAHSSSTPQLRQLTYAGNASDERYRPRPFVVVDTAQRPGVSFQPLWNCNGFERNVGCLLTG
jgi:hypothetical protein